MAASKGKRGRAASARPRERLPDDMLDEVDRFHKDADSESLDDAVEYDVDEDDVEGALDFEDSEPDSDEDVRAGGKLAKIIEAERAIKRKLALNKAGEDSDPEANEEHEDADGTLAWGASREAYYDAEDVDVDFDSDDELAAEEEAEALKMQQEQSKQLSRVHFGLENASATRSRAKDGSDGPDVGASTSGRTLGQQAEALEGVPSEKVTREVVVGADGRREAVLRDAPELQNLLEDFAASFNTVQKKTAPLLKELRAGGLGTAEGLSYLETKHTLLLMYCVHSLFYVLLKLEGRPVKDHPVMTRLVESKAFLEKLRPIDKRLKPQIEKLLRAAEVAEQGGPAQPTADDDAMAYRPNPAGLMPAFEMQDPENVVYRPPKLAPAAMDEEEPRGRARKDERKQRATLRQATNNQFIRDLEAEIVGAPEELRETGGGGVNDALAFLKERQKLEARAQIEEALMMRVPLSKEERKSLKARQRANLSGAAGLHDFADDVAGVLDVNEAEKGFFDKTCETFGGKFRPSCILHGHAHSSDRQQPGALEPAALDETETPVAILVMMFKTHGCLGLGEERCCIEPSIRRVCDAAIYSYSDSIPDAELPGKASLADRRARYDAIKARQQAQIAALDKANARRSPEEDEMYLEAKQRSMDKKKSRAARGRLEPSHPPLQDPQVTEPRKITREILKNRGLTPHHRKDLKNPRKRQRERHAKAEKRRKGQVQEVKMPSGPYTGEASGIKARVSKSRRLE